MSSLNTWPVTFLFWTHNAALKRTILCSKCWHSYLCFLSEAQDVNAAAKSFRVASLIAQTVQQSFPTAWLELMCKYAANQSCATHTSTQHAVRGRVFHAAFNAVFWTFLLDYRDLLPIQCRFDDLSCKRHHSKTAKKVVILQLLCGGKNNFTLPKLIRAYHLPSLHSVLRLPRCSFTAPPPPRGTRPLASPAAESRHVQLMDCTQSLDKIHKHAREGCNKANQREQPVNWHFISTLRFRGFRPSGPGHDVCLDSWFFYW